MFNIAQTRWGARVGMVKRSSMASGRIPMFTGQMFTSQREKKSAPRIVALVELDMPKMRVHIVLSRDAIRERLQELEYPLAPPRELQAGAPYRRTEKL
jgi:hypothetical protein